MHIFQELCQILNEKVKYPILEPVHWDLLRTFKSDYTIHALRHTFASRLLKAGAEISVVSKLIGHADINTSYSTYIYVLND